MSPCKLAASTDEAQLTGRRTSRERANIDYQGESKQRLEDESSETYTNTRSSGAKGIEESLALRELEAMPSSSLARLKELQCGGDNLSAKLSSITSGVRCNWRRRCS